MLTIKNLHTKANSQKILHNLNLTLQAGETHFLMGPNGSGKSSLAKLLAGDPNYTVTQGQIEFNNVNILKLAPEKRLKLGLFVAFQHPVEIPGISFFKILYQAYKQSCSKPVAPAEFAQRVRQIAKKIGLNYKLVERPSSENFSGGERKKLELLQIEILQPKLIVLDEMDSGLDIDSVQTLFEQVSNMTKKQNVAVLIISHYPGILKYVTPDKAHIIQNGTITYSGGKELVGNVETDGFASCPKRKICCPKHNIC